MNFHLCDKVKVRDDLEVGKKYGGFLFNKEMEQYKGVITSILKVVSSYYYLENMKKFKFSNEMLEIIL